jgi:hypothetical protein
MDQAGRLAFVRALAEMDEDARTQQLAGTTADDLPLLFDEAMRLNHPHVAASVEVEGNARGQY